MYADRFWLTFGQFIKYSSRWRAHRAHKMCGRIHFIHKNYKLPVIWACEQCKSDFYRLKRICRWVSSFSETCKHVYMFRTNTTAYIYCRFSVYAERTVDIRICFQKLFSNLITSYTIWILLLISLYSGNSKAISVLFYLLYNNFRDCTVATVRLDTVPREPSFCRSPGQRFKMIYTLMGPWDPQTMILWVLDDTENGSHDWWLYSLTRQISVIW